jgi:hypothetical protein
MKNAVAMAAMLLCGTQAAYAADAATKQPLEQMPAQEKQPGWTVQVTPYLWATGLQGDISPFRRGPTMHVKKSFSDVLSDLDLGGFINVWGRYDRFVFSGDLMYVDTNGAQGTGALPAMQLPGLNVKIPAGAEVTATVRSKQFMSTLLGGYRVVDMPDFKLDALGGARFWHISNQVTVEADLAPLGRLGAGHGESFNWVDPVFGIRTFLRMTDQLSIQAQADAGGFGAGSDLTWSALATINYSFSDRLSASAGYKVLKVDYHHGGHVYNTRMSGPILGLTYRF